MFSFDTSDLEKDIQSALDSLDDWTPEKKVFLFVEGLRCQAEDLVSFRTDPETRDFVAAHEQALWRIKSCIELTLTSIQIDRDGKAKPSHLRVV